MYGGHVSGRIHAPSFWIPSNLQKIAEIPSNLDRLCRKWHEKSKKNDRKMMKNEEKVFFYIKNSQQQYKVIGTLGRPLTRSKVSPTPLFFCSFLPSPQIGPGGPGWPSEPADFTWKNQHIWYSMEDE